MVVILSELADSDDEKPTRAPTRSWIKRRKENGYFETIIRELILEDLAGFCFHCWFFCTVNGF